MKCTLVPLVILSAAIVGPQAWADDSPTARPNQTNRELMKQCMTDQRTKNSGASAADMKRTCKEQIKTYQEHPSVTTPSKAPTP
jgi:hypothetical protein